MVLTLAQKVKSLGINLTKVVQGFHAENFNHLEKN